MQCRRIQHLDALDEVGNTNHVVKRLLKKENMRRKWKRTYCFDVRLREVYPYRQRSLMRSSQEAHPLPLT